MLGKGKARRQTDRKAGTRLAHLRRLGRLMEGAGEDRIVHRSVILGIKHTTNKKDMVILKRLHRSKTGDLHHP